MGGLWSLEAYIYIENCTIDVAYTRYTAYVLTEYYMKSKNNILVAN